MKLIRHLITFVCLLAGSLANAGDKFPVIATDRAIAEEIARNPKEYELGGLVVQGTMKQIIGVFGTYGHPRPGDAFEIDLTHLPKEKLDLTRPNFDPKRDVHPYIPFGGEVIVEKVIVGQKNIGGSVVRLTTETAANRTGGHLIIQVWADELKKGSKVRIYFLESSSDRIGCMAEAEGVLK